MKWLNESKNLIRRNLSGFLALTVAVALVGTIFGLGAAAQAPDVFDGKSWLWSRDDGDMLRVSSSSGQVDLRQPVVDSRGHRIKVTQSDQFLFLHDLDTGRITSVDLTRMGFSGSLAVGTKYDVAIALAGARAAVVDRTRGLVRAIDPATLQVKGEALQLPPPLVGGATFDGNGLLWVGLPSQGTVVALDTQGDSVMVNSTIAVATPGHDLAISALDNGVLALDRTGSDIVAVIGGAPKRITAPVSLAGALVPERTVGAVAAVTVPPAQTVVTIADIGQGAPVGQIPLSKKDGTEVAVPFSGRVYLPDNDNHTVAVFSPDGKPLSTITIPAAEGDLELEVREQHLFVNAPDSQAASVIDEGGVVQIVDKREPVASIPTPAGSTSADPSPPVSQPADGEAGNEPPSAGNPPPGPELTEPGTPGSTADPGAGTPTATDPPNPPGPGGVGTPTPPPTEPPPPREEPPGAPVPVTALAGDEQVTLTWNAAATGDAPVTSYTVSWTGGSVTLAGTARQTVVTGLTNGTTYRFRVIATNRFGQGPPAISGDIVPVDGSPPAAPGKPSATANGGNVTVTWLAVDDGVDYVVRPLRDGIAGADPAQTVRGLSTEFTGLRLGSSYTFTVVAVDAEGRAGAASPRSNAVVPKDKPTVNNLKAGTITTNSVAVTFTVTNGGSPTTCTVSITPGPASQASCGPTVTFTGRAAGTQYTVTVTARNDLGATPKTITVKTSPPPAPTFRAKVTCVDKPSNPDPVYCTGTGGIGVFTNLTTTSEHHREAAGKTITVTCRANGRSIYAYVYNKNKESKIWLKMSTGYWIPWAWVTIDGGDNVGAVPAC